MPARPYRPAAPLGAGQLAGAALFAATAAVLVGGAAHLVTRATFHLDLLVPLAIGAGCGAAIAQVVARLALSRPLVAAALGAASATAGLVVLLALDFRLARSERAAEIDELARVRQGMGQASEEELAAVRRSMLRGWTFGRYARARIGLDDSGQLTGGAPVLGRTGAAALSALELLVAAGLAGAWAARAARHPACPRCGRWRVERPLGAAAHGVARPLAGRLLAGDGDGAAALLRAPDTREQTRVSWLACPAGHDGDGGVVRIAEVRVTRHRRLALHTVAEIELDGELLAAVRRPLAAEAPT